MWKTKLSELLNIRYPLIQGGMAWVADAYLAAAVSNGGGLGVIAGGSAPADIVRQQIRLARTLTDQPFGVNLMLMSPHSADIAAMLCEERVSCVLTGAGNPGKYIPAWKQAGMIVIPVIPSVALGIRMQRAGADAVVAEGCEAGGHIGELTTMALVPQVADALSIPVVAAGGIADGRGMAASFMLGAQGVQMGTRFICATECTAHDAYKQEVIEASDIATLVTGRLNGAPVRAIKNQFARDYAEQEKQGATREELEVFGAGALRAAYLGDVKRGSLMAGQIAGMVKRVEPAADIVREVCERAMALLGQSEGG